MIYIALLRGINVGGHIVKMEHLRKLFMELGFTQVRTYIQSGNVFFEAEQTERETLTQMIEQHLYLALGFKVPVFLRTIPELEQIMALDPFQHLNVTTDMRLCVVFTDETIPDTLALPLRSPKNDMEIIYTTDHEAFMVWYISKLLFSCFLSTSFPSGLTVLSNDPYSSSDSKCLFISSLEKKLPC